MMIGKSGSPSLQRVARLGAFGDTAFTPASHPTQAKIVIQLSKKSVDEHVDKARLVMSSR